MTRLIIFVFCILAISCVKDPAFVDNPEEPQVAPYNFELRLKAKVGTEDFKLNDTFRIDGYNLTMLLWQFYLSDFVVINENDQKIELDDVVLVNMESGHGFEGRGYEIVRLNLPKGIYKELQFSIGLNDSLNATDFTSYTVDEPLGAQGMYWGWAAGYRFVKMEGKYDTTRFSSSHILEPLVFHTGTDSLFRSLKFENEIFTIGTEDVKVYDLEIDFTTVLQGPRPIDIPNEDFTHTLASPDHFTLAEKIMDNFKSAIDFP